MCEETSVLSTKSTQKSLDEDSAPIIVETQTSIIKKRSHGKFNASNSQLKKRPRVGFKHMYIIEFEPTVFTTTVTSGGIPVGMSLIERSRSRRRLDSFEIERNENRVGRQNYMEEGYLNPLERQDILNSAGYAKESMVHVEEEINRIIAMRRESNEVVIRDDVEEHFIPVAENEVEFNPLEDKEEIDDDDVNDCSTFSNDEHNFSRQTASV